MEKLLVKMFCPRKNDNKLWVTFSKIIKKDYMYHLKKERLVEQGHTKPKPKSSKKKAVTGKSCLSSMVFMPREIIVPKKKEKQH